MRNSILSSASRILSILTLATLGFAPLNAQVEFQIGVEYKLPGIYNSFRDNPPHAPRQNTDLHLSAPALNLGVQVKILPDVYLSYDLSSRYSHFYTLYDFNPLTGKSTSNGVDNLFFDQKVGLRYQLALGNFHRLSFTGGVGFMNFNSGYNLNYTSFGGNQHTYKGNYRYQSPFFYLDYNYRKFGLGVSVYKVKSEKFTFSTNFISLGARVFYLL